eukprot:440905_1
MYHIYCCYWCYCTAIFYHLFYTILILIDLLHIQFVLLNISLCGYCSYSIVFVSAQLFTSIITKLISYLNCRYLIFYLDNKSISIITLHPSFVYVIVSIMLVYCTYHCYFYVATAFKPCYPVTIPCYDSVCFIILITIIQLIDVSYYPPSALIYYLALFYYAFCLLLLLILFLMFVFYLYCFNYANYCTLHVICLCFILM